MSRHVVSFVIEVPDLGETEAVDAICALLPEGCEDIVIIAEVVYDRMRRRSDEDA